jgi:hypothetical protein
MVDEPTDEISELERSIGTQLAGASDSLSLGRSRALKSGLALTMMLVVMVLVGLWIDEWFYWGMVALTAVSGTFSFVQALRDPASLVGRNTGDVMKGALEREGTGTVPPTGADAARERIMQLGSDLDMVENFMQGGEVSVQDFLGDPRRLGRGHYYVAHDSSGGAVRWPLLDVAARIVQRVLMADAVVHRSAGDEAPPRGRFVGGRTRGGSCAASDPGRRDR